MGDRGNIGFITRDTECVFFYTHWEGHVITALAIKAISAAHLRWGDPAYATRMALTELIGDLEGESGYGVSTFIEDNEYPVPIIDWRARKVHFLTEDDALEWNEMSPEMKRKALGNGTEFGDFGCSLTKW